MAKTSKRQPDPVRQRASQRDRALDRLSRITTATAVAGAFATVGFGGLAALTYTGSTTAADNGTATNDATITDQQQTQSTNGSNGSATVPVPRATARSGATNQQPVTINPPTVTRGRSHVRTGGS